MAEANVAEFQRKVVLSFYVLLLIAGLAVYWTWGVLYDTWYPFTQGNIGVFTIYVPLIAFGILGILLHSRKKASSA